MPRPVATLAATLVAALATGLAAAQTPLTGITATSPGVTAPTQMVAPVSLRIDPALVRNFQALRQQAVQRARPIRVIGHVSRAALTNLAGTPDLRPLDLKVTATELAAAQSRLEGRLRLAGITTVSAVRGLPYVVVETNAAGLDQLVALGEISAVVEDALLKSFLAESGNRVRLRQAHTFGASGVGTSIAILDTGVERTHPWLTGRVVEEACFSYSSPGTGSTSLCPGGASQATGSGAAAPCTGSSACGHGTHVAGIAAGRSSGFVQGMAPDAAIVAIQVFSRLDDTADRKPCEAMGTTSPCFLSFTSDVLRGLQYVRERAAARNIVAANLSLGGGRHFNACMDDVTRPAIAELAAAGVATVVAAGNDGWSDSIASPACVPQAIAVGATTDTDAVAPFSNTFGLDVLAPGDSIDAPIPGGTIGRKSGTSMAAPHVAGAIAAVRSTRDGRTMPFDQLLQALAGSGPVIIPGPSSQPSLSRRRIDVEVFARTRELGSLTVPAGSQADLDTTSVGRIGAAGDFTHQASSWDAPHYLVPSNGAKIWVGGSSPRGYLSCKAGRMPRLDDNDGYTTAPLRINDYGNPYVCVRTNDGRIAEIKPSLTYTDAREILLGLVTWN